MRKFHIPLISHLHSYRLLCSLPQATFTPTDFCPLSQHTHIPTYGCYTTPTALQRFQSDSESNPTSDCLNTTRLCPLCPSFSEHSSSPPPLCSVTWALFTCSLYSASSAFSGSTSSSQRCHLCVLVFSRLPSRVFSSSTCFTSSSLSSFTFGSLRLRARLLSAFHNELTIASPTAYYEYVYEYGVQVNRNVTILEFSKPI